VLGGDAAFDDADAFGFEEAALEAGEGLADDDMSARGDDAVPRDGLTARASGHGSSGGTSAAGKPHSLGQLAVGGDASFGDALNEGVESLPGGVHAGKDSRNGGELPDGRGSDSSGENFRAKGGAPAYARRENPQGRASAARALGYKEAKGLKLLRNGSGLPVWGV
jgi:hypothetical protein